MFFIRILGFGPEYKTEVKCPSCSKSSTHIFDLTERGIKECEHESVAEGQNKFEFILPNCNKKVYNFDTGFALNNGSKVPGGDVSNQTQVLNIPYYSIFDTRDDRMGRS